MVKILLVSPVVCARYELITVVTTITAPKAAIRERQQLPNQGKDNHILPGTNLLLVTLVAGYELVIVIVTVEVPKSCNQSKSEMAIRKIMAIPYYQ